MNRVAAVQVFLLAIFCLVLSGCGGGSSMMPGPGPTPTPPPFFSGLYQIDETSTVNPATSFHLAGSLMQAGNNLSGVMHTTLAPCVSFNTDLPVTGTLGTTSAGDFSINLVLSLPSGQALSLDLIHPGGHLSVVSGTYSLTGAGCAASDQGNAGGGVMGVSGPWIGHFNSSGGVVSQINMTLNQTGPDAHGLFSATGTANISGGTCFSSAVVDPATLVIGNGSTLILDNSQPGTTGKTTFQGNFEPLPFGGTTFTGTYTSTQGARSETGSVGMEIL
jgi:hypothetical protein